MALNLEPIEALYSPAIRDALRSLAMQVAAGGPGRGQLTRLGSLIQGVRIAADVEGRRSVRRDAPELSLSEPLGGMALMGQMRREGVDLAPEAHEAGHGHTLAKGVRQASLAKRRMAEQLERMHSGADRALTPQEIQDGLLHWTDIYANTVMANTVQSAAGAGIHREVGSDPSVVALRYTAVLDDRVRPHHAAAHGLTAGVGDPIWNDYTPPLGHNCRCTLVPLRPTDLPQARKAEDGSLSARIVPPNFHRAHPDQGFGRGRPDLRIYGV